MPKGPRTLVIALGAEARTPYGGVSLRPRVRSQIGVKSAGARDVRWGPRNNWSSMGKMRLALLSPMLRGLERIETTQGLRQTGVVQSRTGLPASPNPSTLRRFLLRVAPTALPPLRRRQHDRFLARITALPVVAALRC